MVALATAIAGCAPDRDDTTGGDDTTHTDDSGRVYDPTRILDVRIAIAAADWDALRNGGAAR